jgi:hypothetical protein
MKKKIKIKGGQTSGKTIPMTQEQKDEITRISKEFASGFDFPIAGSAWLIADPLHGYLSVFHGVECTIEQLPETKDRPQVLFFTFPDGSKFIPAGSDLKYAEPGAHDWIWIDA